MVQDNKLKEQQIKRLQENLLSIRKIAGWIAEELGNRIGVTKQTISNMENGKAKLTQTQYIAVSSVLDYEMKINKENAVLPQVISILLDNEADEVLDEEKEAEIKVATTAAGGIAGAQLAIGVGTVLAPVALNLLGLVGATVANEFAR